jgi:uncharacterized protein YceH (UPF0502 family)
VRSVLMLRGPQTAGEIKARTARAFEFVAPSQTEVTLKSMAALSTAPVAALPRRPGPKEVPYTHLLSGHPPEEVAERRPTPAATARSSIGACA